MFEYKLKNVEIKADNLDEITFPDLKTRTIIKSGDVVEFTMYDLEKNVSDFTRFKGEVEAQIKHEEAVSENIEHFHPFVKDLTEQELLTAWLYKEATGKAKHYKEKLSQVDNELELVQKEIAWIKEQIPELDIKEEKTDE